MNVLADNPKYRLILDTSRELFMKFGLRKTTVEEICEKAPVSKMTFYKFFPNKIELAKIVLREIFDEGFDSFYRIDAMDLPFPEKVEKIIEWKISMGNRISNEFLQELYSDVVPELRQFVQEKLDVSFRISLEWFVKCQNNGDIRNDIKPEFLMYFLGKISEMISDPHLQNIYKSTGQLTRELLNFFFYGILGGNGVDHAEE